MKQLLGIKRPLVPLVTLLLIVGFLATTLASYFVSKSSVREGIVESGLPLTADNIYSSIQNDLLRPIFISSMMANDTFLRDWALAGERDPTQVVKYLAEIKSKYDTITSFFISDRTRTYYNAGGILKQMHEEDWRDVWYFRVRQMKEPYEINVDPDFGNRDAMTIFINYRLLGYGGEFLGAVGVGLTVMSLRAQISSYRDRFGRDVYFVDADGKVVLTREGDDREETIQKRAGLAGHAAAILAGKDGAYEYERNGRTVLLSTRFIPELGWHVFVEQDEDDAITGIRRALLINLLICFIITFVIVWATRYTIRTYQSRIERMAVTDKLSGLLNRHGFATAVEQAVMESERDREPFSLVLFDVDRFKQINDQLGHVAGDAILQRVGAAARKALRPEDTICRWGGDEFLVLLKGCAQDHAAALAAKIGERIKARPVSIQGKSITVTVSAGVAQYRRGENIDDLTVRADTALYEAKTGGRGTIAQAGRPLALSG
jgi:diguanylate cyclase (GGDEF)-like protein